MWLIYGFFDYFIRYGQDDYGKFLAVFDDAFHSFLIHGAGHGQKEIVEEEWRHFFLQLDEEFVDAGESGIDHGGKGAD